jgi:hypothetical protein
LNFAPENRKLRRQRQAARALRFFAWTVVLGSALLVPACIYDGEYVDAAMSFLIFIAAMISWKRKLFSPIHPTTSGWQATLETNGAIGEAEVSSAMAWMSEHASHVRGLIADTRMAYPPTGSDRIRPELWKSAHWKWFVESHAVANREFARIRR